MATNTSLVPALRAAGVVDASIVAVLHTINASPATAALGVAALLHLCCDAGCSEEIARDTRLQGLRRLAADARGFAAATGEHKTLLQGPAQPHTLMYCSWVQPDYTHA